MMLLFPFVLIIDYSSGLNIIILSAVTDCRTMSESHGLGGRGIFNLQSVAFWMSYSAAFSVTFGSRRSLYWIEDPATFFSGRTSCVRCLVYCRTNCFDRNQWYRRRISTSFEDGKISE
ncbi:hypothetical protein GWI33_017255 [Rhynchophorus ferrugineus]|uniref:Uncharacterized protein n=1 Tax=Rhynchophorus ferrugineus TaxID=354439 RepID=A0A834HZI1_RHYFE|nr:hypothetical protein GWI33_017255 [Rhynchophorus ferrugineus]